MKKTTAMVAFCCLTFLSNAQNTQDPERPIVEINSANEVKPEQVATYDGIEIYYSSFEDLGGNTLLNIHFVNTSDKKVSFVWVVKKDGSTLNSSKSITINPGKTFVQTAALEMKGTLDFAAYSINLTSK